MSSSAISGPIFTDNKRAPAGTAAAPSFAFNDSTGTGVYLVSPGVLGLSTAGVQRVVVDASGNVGIGTASPAVKMHVVGSASTYSRVESTAANDTAFSAKNSVYEAAFGVDNQGGYVAAGNNRPIYFYTSSTLRLVIQSNGTLVSIPTYNNTSGATANMAVTASGEFVRSTSALKYKEDITPVSYGLQTILNMQPIEYKSKCEADKDAVHKFIGFIADWEEANLPALVQKNGDGEVEGFSYDRLTAVLCKAIQEQQEIIGKLEARLAALESK